MSKRKIPPEKYFIMCNGIVVKDMKELALVLDELSNHEFNNHVNQHKNDFSRWLSDVFEEHTLAQKISGMKDKKDIQVAIFKHIVK